MRCCSECINGSLLCTGRQCRHNCSADDEYRCPGEDRCIPNEYRCDGIVDCASKLDEIGCGEHVEDKCREAQKVDSLFNKTDQPFFKQYNK